MTTTIDDEKLEPVSQKRSDSAGTVTSGAKPGWKTTEFWLAVALCLPSVVDEVIRVLDERTDANPWARVAAGIAVGAYAMARSLAKRPA